MATKIPPQEDASDAEFSDDENAPLTHEFGASRLSVQETKNWDVFRSLPPSKGSLSDEGQGILDVLVKFLKVFTYLLTFGVVLIAGVITKGLVLLMTSQLKTHRNITVCSERYLTLLNEKEFIAEIPKAENVVWAWMILFSFALPELGTWFRSTRMCIFKSWKRPPFGDFFWVCLFETFHCIGTAILMYTVLPELDVVKGAMLTNCVAFIPGLFGLLSRTKKESSVGLKVMLDCLSLACQLTGFFVWPIIAHGDSTSSWRVWIIPPAIFLTSFGWWENYVDKRSTVSFIKYLGGIKERLWKTRYFTYMFISLWKILIFFGFMVICMQDRLGNWKAIFELKVAFNPHPINFTEIQETLLGNSFPDANIAAPQDSDIINFSENMTPIYVFLTQVLTAWLCYIFGKFACKIYIQDFSFAFPVNLTVPLTVSLLITGCGLRFEDVCAFKFMPTYLFWECKNGDILNDFVSKDHAWIWVFWVLSQAWITLHIWSPKCERLASTEKLFVSPMYNSLLIDQSLALNRRRDDEGDLKTDNLDFNREEVNKDMGQYYDTVSIQSESSSENTSKTKSSDHITRIYAVATMWHETEDEMMEMLKSILRMDEDQSARRVAQKYLKIVDLDYYEFETHIFFDDAFEIAEENEDENEVNQFVRLMVTLMDGAASYVHQANIRVRPPKKFPAPYGGRLVWTLPGKTKIIAHLKDKSKIRHKKRWSQVMYMYYLLGFKLMDQQISVDRKEVIAENTFLLALDGDIDFTPMAVALLVDLMKKNHNLGAACGRIHPVGGGLMVWYQMFEYAIGHWLQKATEHVIGCVLCSPGCFSLFRAKALMDDNVMRKYTTTSSQARHYVQYDQGEDRWLCTLLLQRGYRVEYCAASDAYTHAPEGFGEFYNQRRRWVPSTMANIMDLLQEYKRTVQINDNISMPYIGYQTMLMVGTILGPGTILLMLVGAFLAAFGLSNWDSFLINVIPIVIFMIVCFTLKSKVQISIAYAMSAVYALVMIVVLVGMMLQFAVEGWSSPSSIFFLASAGSFIITGCLHPKEFICLPCGMVYYLLVPSMYLLLQIYSCYNLNNVSWGTREVAKKEKKKTREDLDKEKKEAEEAKRQKKKEGFLGFLHRDNSKDEDEGSFEVSCAGLFKMLCCTHPKPNTEQQQLASIANSLDILKKRFENIESNMGIAPHERRRSTMKHRPSVGPASGIASDIAEDNDPNTSDKESVKSEPKEERDDLVNPYWMEDKALKRGEVDYLPNAEVQFFKDLIEIYLFPLAKNDTEQQKVERELMELRNKVVFSFSMMNAIFVTIIFLLQQHKDTIHIDWPLGIKTNITFVEDENQVLISNDYLQLEPIGLVFVIFFAVILGIQFVAMLFHRFGTISHILASTDITCCTKKAEDVTEEAYIQKHGVQIVKEMQKLKGIDENDQPENSNERLGRRMTIHNLAKHAQKKQEIGSLDVAFKKRFFSISAEAAENDAETPILGNMRRMSMRRDTLRALAERRETIVHERRQSRIQGLGGEKKSMVRISTISTPEELLLGTLSRGSINKAYKSNSFESEPSADASSNRCSNKYTKTEESFLHIP